MKSPAFDQGYKAYQRGASETANPYPVDDDRHLDWNDGFSEAAEDAGESDIEDYS